MTQELINALMAIVKRAAALDPSTTDDEVYELAEAARAVLAKIADTKGE